MAFTFVCVVNFNMSLCTVCDCLIFLATLCISFWWTCKIGSDGWLNIQNCIVKKHQFTVPLSSVKTHDEIPLPALSENLLFNWLFLSHVLWSPFHLLCFLLLILIVSVCEIKLAHVHTVTHTKIKGNPTINRQNKWKIKESQLRAAQPREYHSPTNVFTCDFHGLTIPTEILSVYLQC